ncbi:MAG: hypothetical protein JAY75_05570, partial [Candidatus Thiodiazotropha taylori]|nr:hypothetical protein [Candidatus Thiodiazotropha taylori]MCW4307676.1 hypothetical protein [Candidatus Thiodiazotropha endolucinida]
FQLYAHGPEGLFSLLERFANFNVVTYVTEAGMGSGLTDIKDNLRQITNYLKYEYSHGAEELTRPSSLYMTCITNMVRQKKGVLQATAQDGSLPKLMQFHVSYYRKLHLHMELEKLRGSDLPWEIIEDLYLIQNVEDLSTIRDLDEEGEVDKNKVLYEAVERGVIFDVVNRLRMKGIDEEMVELFDRKYTEIRRDLINVHFGYDLLHEEKPNFFERSLESVTKCFPAPAGFMEMAERLRRIMKFHQEYYEDLFACA